MNQAEIYNKLVNVHRKHNRLRRLDLGHLYDLAGEMEGYEDHDAWKYIRPQVKNKSTKNA